MELKSTPSSYRNYRSEAKMLVQQLLQDALEKLHREDQRYVAWPLGKQFEPKLCLKCIEDLVQARQHTRFLLCTLCVKCVVFCYFLNPELVFKRQLVSLRRLPGPAGGASPVSGTVQPANTASASP